MSASFLIDTSGYAFLEKQLKTSKSILAVAHKPHKKRKNKQADRQTDKQTSKNTNKQPSKQTNKQATKQTNKETNNQANQTNKNTQWVAVRADTSHSFWGSCGHTRTSHAHSCIPQASEKIETWSKIHHVPNALHIQSPQIKHPTNKKTRKTLVRSPSASFSFRMCLYILVWIYSQLTPIHKQYDGISRWNSSLCAKCQLISREHHVLPEREDMKACSVGRGMQKRVPRANLDAPPPSNSGKGSLIGIP